MDRRLYSHLTAPYQRLHFTLHNTLNHHSSMLRHFLKRKERVYVWMSDWHEAKLLLWVCLEEHCSWGCGCWGCGGGAGRGEECVGLTCHVFEWQTASCFSQAAVRSVCTERGPVSIVLSSGAPCPRHGPARAGALGCENRKPSHALDRLGWGPCPSEIRQKAQLSPHLAQKGD